MIDPVALLAAYDEQVRGAEARTLPAEAVIHRDGPLLRVTGLHRGFVSTGPDVGVRGAELDALIARQRDIFAARGEAVEWKTRAHDQPTDLCERLLAAGFVPEEAETVVVARVGDILASARAADPLPAEVRVRVAESDQDMRAIVQMEEEIWAQDRGWLEDELVAMVGAVPRLTHVFVAEAAGRVVSAAWIVLTPGTSFAGLWGGSTLPAWRGRGLYRALVAVRAQVAADNGADYLQVDASDESRPILERLGFVAVTTTTPYVWTPPAVIS